MWFSIFYQSHPLSLLHALCIFVVFLPLPKSLPLTFTHAFSRLLALFRRLIILHTFLLLLTDT
ncbi:hypothetical protein BKA57DRAFT_179295 [Linnemannia elongata]|nr:hypothetical protein BKA57DRAFT_179295 [Linnemannia elongata]